MKLAILADIHANLEALEAVLIAAEEAGAERLVVLGDVVGYGPDPVACIYRLREAGATCVLGNHDQALVDGRRVRELNPLARDAIVGSREMVGEEELDFIRTFAFRHVESGAAFAHANPVRPEDWEPLYLHHQVSWCLERLDWRAGFVGHTHYPGIYCKMDGQILPLTSSEVAIGRHRYLINPGSVGQPRDGDWRAAFAVWDTDVDRVELRRVEYPVQRTQAKIRELGWPEYQADRLGRGE
ncbi:metallophosphoesterase family protein [Candidatus Latescibacterota bacterium]